MYHKTFYMTLSPPFPHTTNVMTTTQTHSCPLSPPGLTVTSVGEEKQYNPRLTKNKEEFIEIMENLGLAYPKKIGWYPWLWDGKVMEIKYATE